MRYRYAIDQIANSIPEARGRRLEMAARQAFRHRQLEAARANPKGWPWQRRKVWRRNDGGYDTGSLAATQDGRDVTLTGGTFPDPCADWIIAFTDAEEETYRVESRESTSAVKIDRPYEGETGSLKEYRMYQPYVRMPHDMYAWAALVLEADGRRLGEWTVGHVRGRWPAADSMSEGYIANVAEPSEAAGYETGTVTVAKGCAAVTGAGTSFPEWLHGHHFVLDGENVAYRVKTWDGVSAFTLDRPYGGGNAGASRGYQIDPPGAMQIEVTYPKEAQYGLKVDYYALPQELVNDNDLIPGDEAFAAALVDLATADLIMEHIDGSHMSEAMIQERMLRARQKEGRGRSALASMINSNAPEPEEDSCLMDVRYAGQKSPEWSWTFKGD